ncbi:hypothetical protein ACET3Z_001280 [Daucus carota]
MEGKATERDVWSASTMEKTTHKALKIRSNEAAQHWTDALPIGNGRLGGMIWGGVASDTINLNDDTIWTGNPGNYTNPDAPKVLSEVRKLVNDGKYAEATKAAVNLSGNPSEAYQLLGDIKIDFDESHAVYDKETYERELDLDTAIVKVKYTAGGINYTREHFSSSPDKILVTNISASKPGSLSFTIYLDSKLQHESSVQGQNQITMEGGAPMGIKFSAVLELKISDGTGQLHVVDDKKINVKGADWAVICLAASSSFDGPFTKASESKKNPTSESQKVLDLIKNLSYAELSARHLNDYQKLFHRVSLQLSKSSTTVEKDLCSVTGNQSKATEDEKMSTAQRVKSFKTDEDPSFVELLFQYGRYLLISCSRPGTQASNLQGIWNKEIYPPWDGAPHANINLQMNYWPSLPCNLKECQEPLFDYISSLAVNGTKTAKVNYEASGWVVHQVSDIWAKTSPDRGEAVWALWPMGGAWLCTHLWEHYTYTLDKDFLKNKAYPLMEGCALFLLDWLIEGPGGYLETNPSTSPEHMFVAPDGQPASVSYSSTMDMSIIREVFSAVVSASEVLGKSQDDLVKKVLKAQSRLYPTKIAKDGSILEWAQDFEDPEVHHRHVSHLFGLFPGHTITLEKTPDLCKAADFTLQKRGEEGPGWSTTWKAALWARLHNSDNAYRMVKHLINLVDPDREADFEGGLYSNLFTAHPPFQIDGNFGVCAAIAEMLVQSTMEDLYLLPALPRDKWPNGAVKGLKARGGLTVAINWTKGDLHEANLWSNNSNSISTIRLHYREYAVTTKVKFGRVYTFNKILKCINEYPL